MTNDIKYNSCVDTFEHILEYFSFNTRNQSQSNHYIQQLTLNKYNTIKHTIYDK